MKYKLIWRINSLTESSTVINVFVYFVLRSNEFAILISKPISFIKEVANNLNIEIDTFQSNSEGDIVTEIQSCYQNFDGIIINPAGYTHTSVAILDALKAVNIPTVEVHLSDISEREEFRKLSYVSLYATKTIIGKGFDGYKEAIEYFAQRS